MTLRPTLQGLEGSPAGQPPRGTGSCPRVGPRAQRAPRLRLKFWAHSATPLQPCVLGALLCGFWHPSQSPSHRLCDPGIASWLLVDSSPSQASQEHLRVLGGASSPASAPCACPESEASWRGNLEAEQVSPL